MTSCSTLRFFGALVLPTAVLLLPTTLGAQRVVPQEPWPIREWKSIDDRGRTVKHRETPEWRRDSTFDAEGRLVKAVRHLPDGSVAHEAHYAYGGHSGAAEGSSGVRQQSAKWTNISFAKGTNISEDEFHRFLELLPPVPEWTREIRRAGLGYDAREDVSGAGAPRHPWGYYEKDVRDGWLHVSMNMLGQSMEVTVVEAGPDWFEVTDDRGGSRFDYVRDTASIGDEHGWRAQAVTSYDQLGWIVRVVTNELGFPVETWYGETFLVRYHYPQLQATEVLPSGGVAGLWLEFIDARTGEVLLDSRDLEMLRGEVPRFVGAGGVVESVDDDLFVSVQLEHSLHMATGRYALLPLNGGEPWRSLETGGTEDPMLWSRVDYTDSRVRVHIRFREGELILEASRRGKGQVRVVHPEDLELPLEDSDVVRRNASNDNAAIDATRGRDLVGVTRQ